MTPRFHLAAAALVLLAASPVLAQQQNSPADDAAEAAKEALGKIMRSLSGVISSIPQYQMPEVLPNGDIILRRKPAPAPAQKQPPTPPGQTRT